MSLSINKISNYSVNINKSDSRSKKYNSAKQKNAVSFKAVTYSPHPVIRTQMTSKDEQNKYNELSAVLDKNYKNKLNYALKSGKLLNDFSEDKSTVLDNLYKICTTPRDKGLDNMIILRQSLDIIANPYIITQVGEDVPKEYRDYFVSLMTNNSKDINERKNAEKFLKEMHMGTCPTASVEFDLATKQPAEFFRMVEGLTSPNVSVQKTIDTDALSDKASDAIWLLNTFKTPHKHIGWDKTEITLKPDKYAIVRARMQTKNQDKGERSIIDILMQSTMMQLGSQQTYNTLIDKRSPNDWSKEDSGLINFEKTYVESIMENKLTTCVDYQITDENFRLKEYTKPFPEIKKDLLDSLNMGYNVIIGYTWEDEEGRRNNGHEITIVGTKTAKNGETLFICQDSDDEMPESFLIPNLHHAGLPDEIASRNNKEIESWKIGVDEFKKNN